MAENVGVRDLVPAQQAVVLRGAGSPHLRDTIDELRDRASWIASFAADFNSTAAAVDQRSNELRLAEDKVDAERKELARMREELGKAQEALELLEKKQIAERRKHSESVEAEFRELRRCKKDFEDLGVIIQKRAAKAREEEEAVEAKGKEMEERFSRFLLREKGFEDQLAEFKVKLAEFQVRSNQLTVRDREIVDRERRLSELESKLRSREMGFEQREAELDLRLAELSKKERELSKKEREVDERDKHSKEVECKVESREKGFRDRFLEFMTKQREFKDKEREMEEKELDVEKRLKDIQHREEWFQKKAEELELRNRVIEDKEQQSKELQLKHQQCSDDLKVREKRLNGQIEAFKAEQAKCSSELRVKEMDIAEKDKAFKAEQAKCSSELRVKEMDIVEKDKALRKLESEVRQGNDELKSREKRLGQRNEELNAKEARSNQRLEEIEKKEKRLKETEGKVEQLSRALRVKETREKQFKDLECELQDCKKRLAQFQVSDSKNRSLNLKETKFENELKVHGKRVKDLKLKEQQLVEQMKETELIEKQVEGMRRESELKDKKLAELVSSRAKVEPLYSSLCHTSLDHPSEADIRFCVTMSGKDLQVFLNERFKDLDSMEDEVETALRLSHNPPKLVLDAMQGFYPPHLKEGGVEFEEVVIKKSCIKLLEHLTKMSPEIKPTTRKEAMKLAVEWMTRMRSDSEHSLEVLAVLQLLAAYDLASTFEDDELVSHLGVIAHYSQAPKLLQDLGLADKISSVIQKLLEKNLKAEAARFISAFELYSEFPNVTSPKEKEESNSPHLLGDKVTPASTNLALTWTSNTVTSDSRTASGQCTGAKRSWTDACADGAYADHPDQLERSKLAVQQPERSSLTAQQPNFPGPVAFAEVPAQQLDMLNSADRQPEKFNLPGQRRVRFNIPDKQPEKHSLPDQQLERWKSPAQQAERLRNDQGCGNPSSAHSEPFGAGNEMASSPSKLTFVPPCLDNAGMRLRLKTLCLKIESNMLCCHEVSDALGLASDPAEFVLGVVKNPTTFLLKRGGKAVSLAIPEYGPLLLLDCMWRKSLRVNPDTEREALRFAKDWNSKISKLHESDNLQRVCFLLFLAAYKLGSHFDQDEFFSLFDKGHWCGYATKLFEILGFKGFVPKFLEYLMRNERQLQALECISITNLLDEFPSTQTLVREYLRKLPKKSHSTASLNQQIRGINEELKVWEAVEQSIEDQSLSKRIEARIMALQEEIKKVEGQRNWKVNAGSPPATTAPKLSNQVSPQERVTDCAKLSVPATTYTNSAPQPQDESPQKRCRVVESNEFHKTRWSGPNLQLPLHPVGPPPAVFHHPNPGYGFPGYPCPTVLPHPSQAVPFFQNSSYDYPGYGR